MVATGGIWKSGLSLDGVVIRPKSLTLSSAPIELESNTEVSGAGPSNSMIATSTSEHSRRIMTNGASGRSSLGSESRGQIGAPFQAVKENMNAHSGWRVPIKLINVKMSLACYDGDSLEIHAESFARNLEIYCIISYVWSHQDDFAVDEICGVTRR